MNLERVDRSFFRQCALVGFTSLSLVVGTAKAGEKAPGEFQLGKVSIADVTDSYPQTYLREQPGMGGNCTASGGEYQPSFKSVWGTGPISDWITLVDDIVNTAEHIWDLIQDSKPGLVVKTEAANALPRGVKCWLDVDGWQKPMIKIYRISYDNVFGGKMASLDYRLSFIYGGNVKGIGKYITAATINAAKTKVSWANKLDAKATVPAVFNVGTSEAPMAAMQIVVDWSLSNYFSVNQASNVFYIQGDGSIEQLE